MGDRCYMEIHCRSEDRAVFEELGFVVQAEEGAVVRMTDDQANYAHNGNLPTYIPWHGYSTPGSGYGAYMYACDGKDFAEVTGQDGELLVAYKIGYGVDQVSVRQAEDYGRILAKATAMLNLYEKEFSKGSKKRALAASKNPFHET